MSAWSPQDSEALYNVPLWGSGYFRVNGAGNVAVTPDGSEDGPAIDLHELIGQIQRRGVNPPLLLRFDGILRARVRELCDAFDRARRELEYDAPYRAVFPIKVNQQRHVVEALLEEGRQRGLGLEVGSKPELLAVIALLSGEESLVVCNGYKDRYYVETALLSAKLGLRPILVIEKESELETILTVSRELDVKPVIGVRTRPSGRGSGRWQESGGDRSKFGLTTRQIVRVVEELRGAEMLSSLKLLHFHLGSQVTDIRALHHSLREATRMLVGLSRMGVELDWFDVGGGLGIDYDGSRTNFESSVNYSLQEYADDVVAEVAEACREAQLPQPGIISESGRALTAHHAVLVADVLGVSDFGTVGVPDRVEQEEHRLIQDFSELANAVTSKNFQASYHDALHLRDEAMTLFNVGQLSLPERARVEEFFWRSCEKVLRITRTLDYVPDDLEGLERDMADIYFLNFSVFQSMPDSWAIEQLFPALPLHRHGERPTRHAVLADITCDSDGRIDRFIDLRDVKKTLELHPFHEEQPYYLGFFLVGAYQEILGDMHNLFGDTNVVHVDLSARGKPMIKHVVRGDRVQEVLSYVEYFEPDLLRSLRSSIERAIERNDLTAEESALLQRRYEAGLSGYTYLERDSNS